MASTFQTIVLLAGAIIPVVGADGYAVAATPSKSLVFEGTVTSIRQIDHELTPWLVTLMVEKVVSGEFSGPMFSFAVHSPSRAGLEEGQSYTVKALWKGGGYVVDETQWRRRKRIDTRVGSTPANHRLTRALRRTARSL